MLTVVVARYSEDITWVNRLYSNVVILSKNEMVNVGREASSYVWFMWKNYDSLQGDYVFCQGNPFDHCSDFIAAVAERRRHYGLICRWPECHQNADMLKPLDIVDFVATLAVHTGVWIDVNMARFYFANGAQFRVSSDEIRARNKEFYEKLYHISVSIPKAPWVMEALWGHLIPALRLENVKDEDVHFGRP